MSSDQLLERAHEVEQIEGALEAVTVGAGRLIVVEGAAGVGKTALLQTAVRQAGACGMRVLCGHGVELEREFPFGVARQAFGSLLRDRSGTADDCFGGPAALVLPLLEQSRSDRRDDGEFPYLHGFFWLVGNLAESAPVVLALDDAHWSDSPSLRAILYLAQRLEDLRVCLVVAIRDGEPGGPTGLLTELKAHPSGCILCPAPLGRQAVTDLVRSRVGPADETFVDACLEVTEGNPFLVGEVLTTVTSEGVPPTAAGARRVRDLVPRRVLEETLLRLARLGPDASALARALSVLGGRSDLHTMATLAGVPPAAASAAADALAAASILRYDRSFIFAHPLVGSVVYASIGSAQRARMHEAAARILASAGSPLPVVAAQILSSDRGADPWVVERLRRAARAAVLDGAPASAGRYLRRALEEPPPASLRAEVLAELASAEATAGEPGAVPRLRDALEVVTEPALRCRVRTTLASTLHYDGRHLEAADVLEAGLDELHGSNGALQLELEAALIDVARLQPMLRTRVMPRLARLTRGLQGETPIERVLLAHEANRRVFAGEPRTEVIDLVRRAWAGGALLQDERAGTAAAITALAALGWCDDFDAYEDGLRVMQVDARRRGLVLALADATYGLHLSHHFRGRLADAMADAETAIAASRYGWRRHLATASSQLSWTLIELDDLDGAARILDRPDLEDARGTLAYSLVHDARGRLALARGDMRTALREFRDAGRIAESAPIANPSYLPWRSSAALAAARLGDGERARGLVAEELRRAERFGAPRPIGVALRSAGLIEAGESGVEMLRAAAARLAVSPAGLEHARVLTDLGAALRRRGYRRDARGPLREGLELAVGFGAAAIERRARSELVAAGARPRRRQFSGIDALTPSERRVAMMAGSGMSNREIATALFVTVKAVQWHLGNTYRKLGVSCREELPKSWEGGPVTA